MSIGRLVVRLMSSYVLVKWLQRRQARHAGHASPVRWVSRARRRPTSRWHRMSGRRPTGRRTAHR